MTENSASSELCHLDVAALSKLIASRQVSPVEITRALLARIDALDERINAYITVTAESALAEAQRCEREIGSGLVRGPLHGVPIALKDLYDTAGVRTTAGSKILADRVPDADATSVARLRHAGAIVLGKTNLHEFAYGVLTDSSHFGPTHNPWDLERVPGGSSGGSGAAIAADLCIASTGSDTGGSIRIPAALCGAVGLKPTYGRVSTRGLIPLSYSLDHAGPIAKSVFDAAVMLNAMAGFDADDPASVRMAVPDFTAGLRDGAAGLRIAVDPDYALTHIHPEVAAAFREALQTLESLGAAVTEVSVPRIAAGMDAASTILSADATAYHEEWLKTRPDDYPRDVYVRLTRGFDVRAVDAGRAWQTRRLLIRDFERLFEQADLFATPMCAIPAPKLGQRQIELNGEEVPVMTPLTRFTRVFNLTGLPAVSVPCGFSSDGLPIGLQLVGRAFDEATVLRAAHAYEAASPWRDRRPPLSTSEGGQPA